MPHALVLDPATAKVMAVLEGYNRLAWTRHLWDGGSITLEISRYASGAEAVQRGRLLVPDPEDTATVYLIEQVEQEVGEDGRASEVVRASGRSIVGVLAQRLVVPPAGQAYDRQTSVPAETAIKHYVSSHAGPGAAAVRQIPNLTIAPDQGRGTTVSVDGRYQTVLDLVRHIGRLAGMGYQVTYDTSTGGLRFEVIPGVDRTASVFLDPRFETVRGQAWLQSDADRITYVYVAGQGEGADREVVTRYVGVSEPSGFDRREAFQDARDVERGQTAVLQARGDAVLAEAGLEDRLEVEVYEHGSFRPGEHYDLGDLVTVRNEAWGLSRTARVVEVRSEVTADAAVPRVTVALDRPYPTLKERIVGPSSVSAQGAVDYHPQLHAHNGTDGSGTVSHASLTNVTADQHHPQLHAVSHSPGGGDDISGSYVARNLVSAKGDLLAGTGAAALARLAVGTRGQLLLPNSATTTGLEWASRFVGVNASLTLANGDNNNVSTPEALTVLISGPTAAFAITGLTGGESGRMLVLINTTAQPMTLRHGSTLSTTTNRILTPEGVDIQARAAVLIYHGASSRWRVVNYVPVPHGGLQARASSTLTLTTTFADIPGCSVTLDRAGRWLIEGVFDFFAEGGAGTDAAGRLVVGGTAQTPFARAVAASGWWAGTVAQSWLITGVTAGTVAKLQAAKAGGAGTSEVRATNTCITAIWLSP